MTVEELKKNAKEKQFLMLQALKRKNQSEKAYHNAMIDCQEAHLVLWLHSKSDRGEHDNSVRGEVHTPEDESPFQEDS